MSWYDATTGDHYPDMECTAAGKPGWLDYAEARNCDMTVDINDEQFIFIYLSQR
ncbi:AF1514 family protein [Desulfosarcina cetonica]|uniref:AF1514 family protein n=1 Tax=Desulfosarcina cetonica TaxID=90730 RepID=UPI0012ED30A6|nr:AF1514 family protein [Desulfosarcina cetonica]